MFQIYGSLVVLLDTVRMCERQVDARGASNDLPLDFELRDTLQRTLTGTIKTYCLKYEIKPALNRIARIETLLGRVFSCTYAEARRQFKTLHENIEDDLHSRQFWYIPSDKEQYLASVKDIPFKEGPDLIQARYEWYEAGQCYLFDRHTACIMHLMRLAELGLRALGRHLGIELKRAIEFEDWRPILDAVDRKLGALDSEPRTAERARDHSFYSDAASQMLYFKNIWRDNSAHAREQYDKGQALSALERVREFMTLLAEKMEAASN